MTDEFLKLMTAIATDGELFAEFQTDRITVLKRFGVTEEVVTAVIHALRIAALSTTTTSISPSVMKDVTH